MGYVGHEQAYDKNSDALTDELHAGLTKVYETRTLGVSVFFVMRYVRGDNLAKAALTKISLGALLTIKSYLTVIPLLLK